MEGAWEDLISEYKNPKWFRNNSKFIFLYLRTQCQTDGVSQSTGQVGRKGIKDTTDMPQNQVKMVAWKGTWAGHNGKNISGWNKGPLGKFRRRLREAFSTWVENRSCKSRVKKDSRMTWEHLSRQNQRLCYLSWKQRQGSGSGEKAWQEQDKLTGIRADNQSRSLHTQDGEESVGTQ